MNTQEKLIENANKFLSQFDGQETFSRSDMMNAFFQGSMHPIPKKLLIDELASIPESKWKNEEKKQLIAMQELETGQWQICRHLPSSYLTDEANEESKWSVRRQESPYCDRNGNRQWEGRTAFDAIVKAKMALGV